MNLKQVLNEAGIDHLIYDHLTTQQKINHAHIYAEFASNQYNGDGMHPDKLKKLLSDNDIDIDPMLFIFENADDGRIHDSLAREYIGNSTTGNVAIAAICMMVRHLATREWAISQVERGIGDCITAADILCSMCYISESRKREIYKLDNWDVENE